MIKLMLFDLSNVCFNIEEPIFVKMFCEKHSLNYDEFDASYQELVQKAEIGEITGVQVWEKMLEKYGLKGDPVALIDEMMALKEAHQDVLDYANSLRSKIKVAYLTNYSEDYWLRSAKKFDMTKWFDYGKVSYELGFRKPQKEGFEHIMNYFGVKPEETLFTDDSERNIAGAKAIGINTIHFKNLEQLKNDLAVLLNND